MTVTIPSTLQPISESPERRASSSTSTREPPSFVRGHTRRRSAPPTNPTLDPATALVLAQARLSAAQAETTLQRTAAEGLRVANAQLRAQSMDLAERVKDLEAQLEAALSEREQPLTPRTESSTNEYNPPDLSDVNARSLSFPSIIDTRSSNELEDPTTALWKIYTDLRAAEARLDTVYTYVRAERDPALIRDTHWPLFCAVQRLQATFARRPR